MFALLHTLLPTEKATESPAFQAKAQVHTCAFAVAVEGKIWQRGVKNWENTPSVTCEHRGGTMGQSIKDQWEKHK